jgi:hypothetical protein
MEQIDKRIVILTYGWVMIGDYSRNGDTATLTNASVIRKWGTERGLGQIALTGTTKNTILDPVGIAEFPIASVITTIRCNSD